MRSKLALRRETLAELAADQMKAVGGGARDEQVSLIICAESDCSCGCSDVCCNSVDCADVITVVWTIITAPTRAI